MIPYPRRKGMANFDRSVILRDYDISLIDRSDLLEDKNFYSFVSSNVPLDKIKEYEHELINYEMFQAAIQTQNLELLNYLLSKKVFYVRGYLIMAIETNNVNIFIACNKITRLSINNEDIVIASIRVGNIEIFKMMIIQIIPLHKKRTDFYTMLLFITERK